MRGVALLALLCAAALLLALTPLDPKLTYGLQRNATATSASAPIDPSDNTPYSRRNVRFDSHGTSCDAWLYTPTNRGSSGGGAANPAVRYPVVVMGHGLGAQKELGLHRFADAFARAGQAVFVFDYRTFGGSDGEPRHWASPRRHLEDWRSALRFVKSGGLGPEYDTDKVALWGTSYAGGHALVVASEQPPGSLAAVVSMIPHLDGLAASKASVRRRGLLASLRLVAAGLHDRARAAVSEIVHRAATWLLQPDIPPMAVADSNSSNSTAGKGAEVGSVAQLVEEVRRRLRDAAAPVLRTLPYPLLPPAYVKLVGLEGDMALMELSAEQLHAYFSKHPKVYEGGWRPLVLSRFTLETSSYSPVHSVPRVAAPVLFISALKDQLCPAELVRSAAALLPPTNGSSSSRGSSSGGESGSSSSSNSSVGGAELLELNCTHFEAYLGDHLAAATRTMVEFVTRYMAPPPLRPQPSSSPPPPPLPEASPAVATPSPQHQHVTDAAEEGGGGGGAAAAEAAAAETGVSRESEVEVGAEVVES